MMTPTSLLLLILSMMSASLSAPIDDENQTGQYMDVSEINPEPKLDQRTPVLLDDIALPDTSSRNADPCTAKGCKWPKTGRYVYIPYYISDDYTSRERSIIMKGLESFHRSTCIRFVPWKPDDRHFIYFKSDTGCWSNVGRQKKGQEISLNKKGCMRHRTVQHEILHALGFKHEISRSDRDKYVKILFENIKPGKINNFKKVQTNNLKTPYDFKSVMQYSKYAFSRNKKPTIVAKCDPNLDFRHAKQMSINDITRVNRLYKCAL